MKNIVILVILALVILSSPVLGQPYYTPGGQLGTDAPGSPYVYTPDGGMAIKTPHSPYVTPLYDNRPRYPGQGPMEGRADGQSDGAINLPSKAYQRESAYRESKAAHRAKVKKMKKASGQKPHNSWQLK